MVLVLGGPLQFLLCSVKENVDGYPLALGKPAPFHQFLPYPLLFTWNQMCSANQNL